VISPETIATIRERTDIVAVVRESVPSLKKRGRSWTGLCPFHKERTPSFHVNGERGFFKCFGCGESGDVISFLMKELSYTFHEACHALADRLGIVIEEDARERTEIDRAKKAKDDLYAANAAAAAWFEEQLRRHPLRSYALEELARRGIEPGSKPEVDEALKAFRIGYAPNEWDGLAGFFRQQGISPVAAESVGLLAPRSSSNGHYDRFRHRLMFAVVDTQGRVVAFSGRALAEPPNAEQKPGAEKPAKYINSKESPIYTKGNVLFGLFQARQAIRQEELAIVVEGNFDVFSLHARGLANVVAPLGTAFTPEQATLLTRYANKVVLLFDGDAAGRKATKASRAPCRHAGLVARVAELPQGEDPDDFARRKGVAELRIRIKEAKGLLVFLIDQELDEAFVAADFHEKLARVEAIADLIASEDDPLVRLEASTHADSVVAGRLNILGAESLRALHHKLRSGARPRAPTPPPRQQPPKREPETYGPASHEVGPRPAKNPGAVERRDIVGALLDFPSLLGDPEIAGALVYLEGPAVLTVAALRKAWTKEKGLDTTAFLAQIPPAIQGFAHARFAVPVHESEGAAKEYLLASAQRLERLILEHEAGQVARELFRADDEDRDTALREITERRTKQLRQSVGSGSSNARVERAVESPPGQGGAKESGATPHEERPFQEAAGEDGRGERQARQAERAAGQGEVGADGSDGQEGDAGQGPAFPERPDSEPDVGAGQAREDD
jgi:DNA primase